MRNVRTVVVGGGLFGCITAAALRSIGENVVVIDDHRPRRGSDPAACLIKPGWVSSMPKEQFDQSIKLLDDLYGVQDIHFQVNGLVTSKVFWVDPKSILKKPDVVGTVLGVFGTRTDGWKIQFNADDEDGNSFDNPRTIYAQKVILCCGAWAEELAKGVVSVVGQVGQASSYLGQVATPTIDVWAPYKQLVKFNRTPQHVWVGDGAAIITKNWDAGHISRNEERCDRAAGGLPLVQRQTGIRPYVKDAKPCFLKEASPDLWVLTGGAKNGTVAAAWAARRLMESAAWSTTSNI